MGAVDRMAREASPEALTEALAAPTHSGSVARLLADDAAGEALRAPRPAGRRHRPRRRGSGASGEAAGGLLAADTVGRLLGITRQAVDKRRGAGKLLALRIRGDWHYPAAQFSTDGEVLDGIAELVAAMPEAGPWSVLDFLLAPDAALGGRSPLAAMRGRRPGRPPPAAGGARGRRFG